MSKPSRLVNDTNVWLSALYFSGKPAQIVHLIEEKQVVSVISDFILNELKEKMTINFNTPSFAANATISYIESLSEKVKTSGKNFGLRDSADNTILETAVAGKCHWLVTGDKDLLTLKSHKNIHIVKPAEFLLKYG